MSFVRRFRIFVRKTLYFDRRISDLGPQYFGCPYDCSGRNADPRHGCPKCEYQIQRRFFEKELAREIAKDRKPDPEADELYTLEYLQQAYVVVTRANAERRRGHRPRWNVLLGRLVDIYRSEINRVRTFDAWNQKQETQRLLETLRSGGGGNRAISDMEEYDEEG